MSLESLRPLKSLASPPERNLNNLLLKMKRYIYILSLLVAGAAAPLHAQQDSTLNRTVVVEQEYTPDIQSATKVNILPTVEVPTAEKRAVEYDVTATPISAMPTSTLPAFSGEESATQALPGYARLGYGNRWNLDAYAHYRFALSPQDRLQVRFSLDGNNGERECLRENNGTQPDNGAAARLNRWDAYFYHTEAAADYRHLFRRMALDARAQLGLSNFNYLPNVAEDQGNERQKFLSWDVHVGVTSTDNSLPIQFKAETNLLSYSRKNDFLWQEMQEYILRTRGEAYGNIDEERQVGVAVSMDNLFYPAPRRQGDEYLHSAERFQDYTVLEANPYYLHRQGNWNFRLGANLQLSLQYGKSFQASPDVEVSYDLFKKYRFYLQATGGRRANDFRALEQQNPYLLLYRSNGLLQPEDSYETLNAVAGVKSSPLEGLWLHLYGGYQLLENDLFTGYTALDTQGYVFASQRDTRNFRVGIDASYSYKELFTLSASATKYAWRASHTEADKAGNELRDCLFAFKPDLRLEFTATLHPLTPLHIEVGYRHVVREAYSLGKMNPISNLHAHVSYELLENIALYARAENLLNKQYQLSWGHFAQKLHFWGGMSFRF